MFLNAVLGLDDDLAILSRLATVGAPGEKVPADLDVVVGELAVLVVVHAEKLGLLRGAKLEAGDEVDDLGDRGGHDEGVGAGGDDGGDLPAENDEVAIEETALGTGVDTIETDDGIGGEESVEDETDDTADTVLSEDIEGIVNADEELDLGSEVAGDASDDTEEDAGPGVDETRGGSGSDETRDGTGAPADHGPLLSQAVIEETPGHGGEHGSEARVPGGHDGAEVGTEGGTTVESEPTEPEEDCAESDEGDVVGTEVHHHLLIAAAENP